MNFKKIENVCNAIIIVLLILVLMLFIAMVLDMVGVVKITSIYTLVWSPRLTQTSLAQKDSQLDKLNEILLENQKLEEQNQQILEE